MGNYENNTFEIKASKIIRKNIINLRKKKGWNQSRLANEAKISKAALSLIEGGGRIPNTSTLYKIALALKVQNHEILGEKVELISEVDQRNKNFYSKWSILNALNETNQDLIYRIANIFNSK